MLDKNLIAFGNAYDFEFETELAYGFINNYLVSVSNIGNKKAAFINCFFPLEEEGGLSEFELSGAVAALQLEALKNCEICDNGIYFSARCSLNDFDNAINAVIKLLEDSGADSSSVCSDCGCELDDDERKASVVDGRMAMLCLECAADFMANTVIGTAPKEKKRSRGVFGAILGGFIGVLVTLALFIYLPFSGIKESFGGELASDAILLAIPLSALIAVLCYVFFRLFTGIKGNRRMIPCIIISLIFSVINTYGATAVLYAKQFGIDSESFGKVFDIILRAPFTDEIYRVDFLKHGFFGLIAVIIVALIYSIIFDDAKKKAPALLTLKSSKNSTEDEIEYKEELAEEEAYEDTEEAEDDSEL